MGIMRAIHLHLGPQLELLQQVVNEEQGMLLLLGADGSYLAGVRDHALG